MNGRLAALCIGSLVAAIALLLLAPRSSYQPGALLSAHQQLAGDCAACHRAWRGPFSAGCVNCHGALSDNNPHAGFDVTERDSGLIAGHKLTVSAAENLECLSCHSEHQGPAVNINRSAALACTWCHKHPAIDKVAEHEVAVMRRKFSIHHLFRQPFNHYQHQQLILSHAPSRGGFSCTACHLVPAVAPGGQEQMRFKWSGCAGAGCHLTPQDGYMQLPAALGPAPTTIAYSGVFAVRHINAVFVHSAGHLRSSCEECHFRMTASRNPDDEASLAIKRCFSCHSHQPALAPEPRPSSVMNLVPAAFAAVVKPAQPVVACGACHLFHTFGVVPTLDFATRAPAFPPNRLRHLVLTIYLPHWPQRAGSSRLGLLPRHPVQFSPWWLGLLAIGFVGYRFTRYLREPRPRRQPQEALAGVAPQRAREVPAVDDTYQTNVRHLYIIGEAAGTASINLAMRSGRQVIEAIVNELNHAPAPVRPAVYDVVIVGCGPAGLGATATAKVSGLKYATLEKLTPASTLRSYPRAKFVQATPIDIAEYGSFFLEGDDSREQLIQEWEKIITQMGLRINAREEVIGVSREQDLLVVRTARGNAYPARCVVLAIGVRGNPRRLNLPGEVPGRVFYNLIEPDEFTGRKILVVGGGNAGAETAQALAAAPLGNTVSYSFRSPVLTNVTRENAEAIVALQQSKAITLYPASALTRIRPGQVVLEPIKAAAAQPGSAGVAAPVEIENDVIFAMIGAELPTEFLRSIGVRMVKKGRLYG